MSESIQLDDRSTSGVLQPPQNPPDNEAEDESVYPTGWKFWAVFINVALTLTFVSLDMSMIATAIPKITDEFQSALDIGWYFSAMLLTNCAFQFAFGKLYTVYSLKWVFTATMVIFLIGNLISATAPSSKALIAGRAVAGLGLSGVTAGLMLMLTVGIPRRKRPLYGAIGGGIDMVCQAAGPALGGFITDGLGWRWCFWINLPLGAMSLLVAIFWMHDPRTNLDSTLSWKTKIYKLDLISSAFFVPAITALLLALQWGGHQYGWSNPLIICLFVVFGVLFTVFVWLQYRGGDDAMLPRRIIGQRSILSGMIFSFALQSAQSVIYIFMPIYLQAAKQRTPSQSGVQILPGIGAIFVGVILAGPLISAWGYYTPFMLISGLGSPIATGLLTTLKYNSSMARVYGYQILHGLSFGLGAQAPLSVYQTVLPSKDVSMGAATFLFAGGAGPMIFISVAQTIFTSKLKADIPEYAPYSNSTAFGVTSFPTVPSEAGPEALNDVLMGYAEAITQTWYLAVGLACVSFVSALGTEWRSVKQKKA